MSSSLYKEFFKPILRKYPHLDDIVDIRTVKYNYNYTFVIVFLRNNSTEVYEIEEKEDGSSLAKILSLPPSSSNDKTYFWQSCFSSNPMLIESNNLYYLVSDKLYKFGLPSKIFYFNADYSNNEVSYPVAIDYGWKTAYFLNASPYPVGIKLVHIKKWLSELIKKNGNRPLHNLNEQRTKLIKEGRGGMDVYTASDLLLPSEILSSITQNGEFQNIDDINIKSSMFWRLFGLQISEEFSLHLVNPERNALGPLMEDGDIEVYTRYTPTTLPKAPPFKVLDVEVII